MRGEGGGGRGEGGGGRSLSIILIQQNLSILDP